VNHTIHAIKKILLAVLLMTVGLLAQGQNEPASQIVVNFAEVTAGRNDQTALGLYFTFTDANGRPLPPANTNNATILLETGQSVQARVEEPNSPLFVVIVLDASGSMQAAAEPMRRAAIEAVNALPEGTQFSIITFNRVISTATAFTRDKNGVINEIAGYQPARPSDPNAGTCLFDATFAAVQKAAEIPLPARRTVVLFTDGRDELTAGRGDTCSQRTFDEVVARATLVTDPVSINSVGLRGSVAIAESELVGMSEQSKGFAAIGSLEQLPELFQRIVDGLRNQRVARADFCITRGPHTATLLVGSGFGQQAAQLSDTLSFQTNLDCIPPTPTPVIKPEIRVTGLNYDRTTETVQFQIIGQGLDQIAEYNIQAVDRDGNTITQFDQIAPLSGPLSFDVSAVLDGAVEVRVVAFTADGSIASDDDQRVNVLRPTPTFTVSPVPTQTFTPSLTPLPISANVDSIEYDQEADVITVNLFYLQRTEIARIVIDVFDRNNIRRATLEPQSIDDRVQLSGQGLVPGDQYTVRVQARSTSGAILSDSVSEFIYARELTPTPTNSPTPSATPSPTEVVILAELDSIGYDDASDTILINLRYENQALIDSIEVDILDANNIRVDTLVPPVESEVRYQPGTKLVPQGDYIFRIRAVDAAGRIVARSETRFRYPKIVTATPTPSETPTLTFTPSHTPTATPVVTTLAFTGVDLDEINRTLSIDFTGENREQATQFRLQINNDGGVIAKSFDFLANEVGDSLEVPLDGLSDGRYRLVLMAMGANNAILANTEVQIDLRLPVPTATPSPTLVDRIRENPVVGIIIGVIVLALIALLVFLVGGQRREKARKASAASSLPSMTGAIVISPQMREDANRTAAPKPSLDTSPIPPGRPDLEAPTMRPTAMDPGATNAVIGMGMGERTAAVLPTPAALIVQETPDSSWAGKRVEITSSPFRIGRTGPRNNDITLDGDKNLSRAHAELLLENGRWILIDNGSALGTTVNDGDKISGRIPLNEGDRIRLGGTTLLIFTMRS
jgi:pSer/pThr/pTyr-binding forkhead associated (FHA) protein